MKKFTLWMVFLFSLVFIAGCGNEQQPVQQTQSQTPTTEAPKPASVDVEGTWQAVEFRDTLEKVFLLKYDDAASRLKATEALKDVVPVLKIQGNKAPQTCQNSWMRMVMLLAKNNLATKKMR